MNVCVKGSNLEWEEGHALVAQNPHHKKDHEGDADILVWERARGFDLSNFDLEDYEAALGNFDEEKYLGCGRNSLDEVEGYELTLI